jgi:tetratricopeptide (TPR) repeat protein
MLYRLLFFLLLPLSFGLPSVAQTKPAATPPKPSAEAQTLEKASQLMLDRKYESAFKLLQRFDPKHRRPAIALKQTELALNYYLRSREFEAFGFRDLGPLERLDSLRTRYTRAAIPYPFPVERTLLNLKSRFPTNYKVSRALGDYYYQVLQCECAEAEKSPKALMSLIVRYYTIANSHGLGDFTSYYALGYVRMSQGRFAESVPYFKRAIKLRPDYAWAHFNLAYSYNELKQLAKASEEARTAARLFTDDPQMKGDAIFMAEDIEKRLAATSTNVKASTKK